MVLLHLPKDIGDEPLYLKFIPFFSPYNFIFCLGLWITTECGRMQVSPGEVAVMPQGFRFAVDLPDGSSRGYVAEIFGTHFRLPDLGPIGTFSEGLFLSVLIFDATCHQFEQTVNSLMTCRCQWTRRCERFPCTHCLV